MAIKSIVPVAPPLNYPPSVHVSTTGPMSGFSHKKRRKPTRMPGDGDEARHPLLYMAESSSESSADDGEDENVGNWMGSSSKLLLRESRANTSNSLAFGAETSDVTARLRGLIETCGSLEKFLSDFAHRVQKINSTLTLVDASRRLAKKLTSAQESFAVEPLEKQRTRPPSISNAKGPLSARVLVDLLRDIADAVVSFNSAILDFEDFFPDEKGYRALEEFQYDLLALVLFLEYFGTDKNTIHMSEFVATRVELLKSNLEKTHAFLKRFKKRGILCISYAQERSSKMTSDAATVATFFAGVAATVIQYSMEDKSSAKGIVINTLWFSSLALSAGSAISAMLALSWISAVFSRPKRRLSWYIRFWIRSGYLILLIASVVAFLAGLVMFVFDSQPNIITFWVIVGITAFCMIGLGSIAFVFIKGRIDMIKLRRQVRKKSKPSEGQRYYLDHVFQQLRKKWSKSFRKGTPQSSSRRKNQPSFSPRVILNLFSFFQSEVGLRYHQVHDPEIGTGEKDMEEKSAVRVTLGGLVSLRKDALGTAQSRLSPPEVNVPNSALSPEELVELKHQLRHARHRVLNMQFSPGGRWLVVCYKYRCRVYDAENSFEYVKALPQSARRRIKQVEWAPDGKHLVARLSRGVKIWTVDETGNFTPEKATMLLNSDLTDIKWLNDDNFLAATYKEVIRVTVVNEPRAFTTMYKDEQPVKDQVRHLRQVYTIKESKVVVIVATFKLKGLPEGRAIDCVLTYGMRIYNERPAPSQKPVHGFIQQLPLSDAFRSLSIGPLDDTDGSLRYMLIGYKTKLPEIWTINVITGEISLRKRLELQPKEKSDNKVECGEAFFIGHEQEFIACVEGATMHFWRLRTFEHFHKFNLADEEEDVEELLVITWITRTQGLTMATAYEGSPPRLWGKGGKQEDQDMEKRESESELVTSPDSYDPQLDPEADTQAPHFFDSTNLATPQHEVAPPSGNLPFAQFKPQNGG